MPNPSLTYFDKVWNDHEVASLPNGDALLYVDRHLLHEVSSPQAFATLARRGIGVRRPDLTLAVTDHIVPTDAFGERYWVPGSQELVDSLRDYAHSADIGFVGPGHRSQGIVHVIGPELGFVLPGVLVVCGDSHTCTLGGVGAVGWGIGTSEVAHVLATQTVRQTKPHACEVRIEGHLAPEATAKDLALRVVRTLGPGGGTGKALEFTGEGVADLSIAGRMTLCNLSVETGAKVGVVAPDATTFEYFEPILGLGDKQYDALCHEWNALAPDTDARYESTWTIDASSIRPSVTWGLRPCDTVALGETVPADERGTGLSESEFERALEYMGLRRGQPLADIPIDVAFVGSCTNGRFDDIEAAAEVVRGKRIAPGVRALVVPGSQSVARQAIQAGLDVVFRDAGFEWRSAGCSMCVSINNDRVDPGQRCISSSNRNFRGRQGPRSRTHLASPAVVAASAIVGKISSPSDLA